MRVHTRQKHPLKILCLVLAVCLLSGCGLLQSRSDPPAAPSPVPTPVPTPIPTPTPAPTPDPEEEARKQRLDEAQDGFIWDKGYLYVIDEDGNLKTDCWIGVLYFGEDGRYTSGSKELDILVADVIKRNTDDSMTRFEKLRAVYDYTRDHIEYVGWANHEMTYEPAHGEDGWMIPIAAKAIEDTHGNCYYFAAEFTALARGLGYQAYAVGGLFSAMEDPHGWVVILDEDGKEWLCDPEMEYKLSYWLEQMSGQAIASYFYRNEEELEAETALGYAAVCDPFEPERKEAEARNAAASSGRPGSGEAAAETPEATEGLTTDKTAP